MVRAVTACVADACGLNAYWYIYDVVVEGDGGACTLRKCRVCRTV